MCEDKQHESFFRRLLTASGFPRHKITVRKYPSGKGAGEKHVRDKFPIEVRQHRRRATHMLCCLLAVADADKRSVDQRHAELWGALTPARSADERIAVFIPKRNIETWIHYLLGKGPVDEETAYTKLARPSECHPGVDRLVELARGHAQEGLPDDCPPSLRRAITDECPRLR